MPETAPPGAIPTPPAAAPSDPDHLLWYGEPAEHWLEALPIGNGRLGAMVFGGVQTEVLQLNEDTLWAGGPHDYARPSSTAALARIRELVFAGEWQQAQELIDAEFMGHPVRQMPYQPVGSLRITADGTGPVAGYRRTLDLDAGLATTEFVQDGVRHRRSVLATAADQVIAMRVQADRPGSLTFTVGFDTPQAARHTSPDPRTVALTGTGGDAHGRTGQVRFTALCRALLDGTGTVHSADGTLQVVGADTVTLLVSVATSHRSWTDTGGDPETEAAARLDAAGEYPWRDLLGRHVDDHRALFRRSLLTIPPTTAAALPTDQRVRAFATGTDPRLVSLYYHYGRYLLMSSSRPGTQPANLQGLWNDLMDPPWGSKYTININTQMNYWPAGPANLIECWDPVFAMLEELAESGSRTARTMYGARGWVAHHNTDLWRGTAPVDGAFWGMWPTGGAWLALAIWERYRFTGDREHLSRHHHLLEGAVLFFLDTLVPDPRSGLLVTCPSVSPENTHHHPDAASVCAGPAMDMQILRDLFDAYVQAGAVLGVAGEGHTRAAETVRRLAPGLLIGRNGQLQEWQQDWDDTAEPGHRHLSHLYALHPGARITPRQTPELAAAARTVLENRGDEATGWSTAWKINLWARLGDGDRAYRLLTGLLTAKHTAPNLFDLHPPFQIDGNFGATAALTEMLLQSHHGELHLLPALPAQLPDGSVTGLLAHGGVEADLWWRSHRLVEARLRTRLDGPVTVRSRHPLVVTRGTERIDVERPAPDTCVLPGSSGTEYLLRPAGGTPGR